MIKKRILFGSIMPAVTYFDLQKNNANYLNYRRPRLYSQALRKRKFTRDKSALHTLFREKACCVARDRLILGT